MSNKDFVPIAKISPKKESRIFFNIRLSKLIISNSKISLRLGYHKFLGHQSPQRLPSKKPIMISCDPLLTVLSLEVVTS